jgi:CHAT domain-containing protein
VLHIATHGFYLDPRAAEGAPCPLHPPPEAAVRENPLLAEDFEGSRRKWVHLVSAVRENPLLCSGLALAGANTWLRGGTPPDDARNGLLTAADVTALDLTGTELVVLSACRTGLGAIQAGEGVLGLRRSFEIAGARTLVLSLWKVDDLATTLLMEQFYQRLLAGRDTDVALRDARLRVRDLTVGDIRRRWLSPEVVERLSGGVPAARERLLGLAAADDGHRPFEHPFYWGAFICQGDTAPLPAVDEGSA